MNYRTITQEDVYQQMATLAADAMNPIGGAVSLAELAIILKTTREQVKEHLSTLLLDDIVNVEHFNLSTEEDCSPPYWGYFLTEKGKDTDAYREAVKKEEKLLMECFGVS